MNDVPVLNQINLVVRDVAVSAAFYQRLGVTIQPMAPPWDRHHRPAATPDGLAFDLDSTAFARHWDRGWPPDRPGAVIGFRVERRDTVDRLYRDLTGAGYRGQQEPYDAFWGARYAVVEDPDGNAVGIMSTIDPATTAPPPAID